MLFNNITRIREILLDGYLIKERILDRKRLTGALSLTPTRDASHVSEIFGYLCTETWLQQSRDWQSTASTV
jgi:hypothetical protein